MTKKRDEMVSKVIGKVKQHGDKVILCTTNFKGKEEL